MFNAKEEEADMIFKHFDQDQNNVIDQFEFVTGLAFLAHGTLEEKAELIFNMYDFDKSKYITKDELTILMTNSLCALQSLAKAKPPKQSVITKKTDDFFAKADVDGNLRITLKEFIEFVKTDKDILNCLIDFGIAKKEDMGTDFGNGHEFFFDMDLQDEIERPESYQDETRVLAKYNIDFDVVEKYTRE